MHFTVKSDFLTPTFFSLLSSQFFWLTGSNHGVDKWKEIRSTLIFLSQLEHTCPRSLRLEEYGIWFVSKKLFLMLDSFICASVHWGSCYYGSELADVWYVCLSCCYIRCWSQHLEWSHQMWRLTTGKVRGLSFNSGPITDPLIVHFTSVHIALVIL